MAGTITLDTLRLLLRRHVTEDAGTPYQKFGLDESMCRCSGWNPYAAIEQLYPDKSKLWDRYGGWLADIYS